MSINVQHISYNHPDRQTLFSDITFTINSGDKIALIGNNGIGKSTILKIIAGQLTVASGSIETTDTPYIVPQHFGQFNNLTIAQALGIESKLNALNAITNGDASVENFTILNDDWEIETRINEAFAFWGINYLNPQQKMDALSGGEKTKVFLAGIAINNPQIILFDEPTNHLDVKSRQLLYNIVENSKATILLVSHDRTLLNLLNMIYEIDKSGVTVYGGNYDFYKALKEEKLTALQNQLSDKEKELRAARKTARETEERKQKQDARGKNKSAKEGVARILMKTLKNKAEESSSKLKDKHAEKIESISGDLKQIRQKLTDNSTLKIGFTNANNFYNGKTLIKANNVNHAYSGSFLWKEALNIEIKYADRLAITGNNGSGKTTLLNILLGKLAPSTGEITCANFNAIYIDQEYSVIDNRLTVFEQIEQFNEQHLQEHELKTLLHRFLFPVSTWDKTCDKLSGGEKMKLVFCCLIAGNKAPDILALDEPTNNLDIHSMEIISSAIKEYTGTLILISHDTYFANEIGINYCINS